MITQGRESQKLKPRRPQLNIWIDLSPLIWFSINMLKSKRIWKAEFALGFQTAGSEEATISSVPGLCLWDRQTRVWRSAVAASTYSITQRQIDKRKRGSGKDPSKERGFLDITIHWNVTGSVYRKWQRSVDSQSAILALPCDLNSPQPWIHWDNGILHCRNGVSLHSLLLTFLPSDPSFPGFPGRPLSPLKPGRPGRPGGPGGQSWHTSLEKKMKPSK